MSPAGWTPEQEDEFRKLVGDGANAIVLAARFDKSPEAIHRKAQRLMLKLPRAPRAKQNTATFWTDDKRAEAEQRFRAGETYAEIAKAIRGSTRSSVGAVLHRMGISDPSRRIMEGRKHSLANPPRPVKASPYRPSLLGKTTPKKPTPAQPWIGEVPPTAKPFYERKSNECRWPFGVSVDLHCCCQPATREGYCETHAKIAFVPREESRKRAERRMDRLARHYG